MEQLAFLRPVQLEDLRDLEQFSYEAGTGFIHLPKDRQLLKAKVEASLHSFSSSIEKPHHESYFFVLQWGEKIVGISGIISRIGMTEPFYAYHLLKSPQESSFLKLKREIPILHFIHARKKPTELCALFLQAPYRHKAYGKLLSFSRFLFIGAFKERFAPVVIAELRGYSDEVGRSPFWDAIGKPFFGMGFEEANRLRIAHPECIEEIFPTHPIYPMLLPKEAQAVIGVSHSDTKPALSLLKKQGFLTSHYIDLFDAGPHLYAHTEDIYGIKEAKLAKIKNVHEEEKGKKALLSNDRLDFRSCYCSIEVDEAGDLSIEKNALEALKVEVGSTIRYLIMD